MTDDSARGDAELESYVAAFRVDVDRPVDVDAAWHRFEAPPPVPSRWRTPVVVSVVGVAAALAASLVARVVTEPQQLAPQPPQTASDQGRLDPPQQASSEQRGPATPVGVPAMPSQTDEPEGMVGATPEDAPGSGPRPARREAPPATTSSPSPAQSSRLAEELRLIKAMQAALRRGQPRAAMRWYSEHARAFPDSAFKEECELARARALCALQDFEALREGQAAFERAHPQSHLLSVVRTICEKPDHDEP